MLPIKNQDNRPFAKEKKRKLVYQDGDYGRHLGFLIGTILAIFDLQVAPMLPFKSQVNWPFSSREEAYNIFLKLAAMAVISDLRSEQFQLHHENTPI